MVEESPEAVATPTKKAAEDQPLQVSEPVPCTIPGCCVKTITEHVRFNAMMVCGECKNIIKCFDDERAFQNYLTFCRSRRRTVLTGHVKNYWTVAFRSYDTYSR